MNPRSGVKSKQNRACQNDLVDVLSILSQQIQTKKQTRLHLPVSNAILDLDAPFPKLIAEDN
jgi:hypothetical protein